MWTSEYFNEVIQSHKRLNQFYNQTNALTAVEKLYCTHHFNETYSTLEKVLGTHYGFSLPVGETTEHTQVLYGILSS